MKKLFLSLMLLWATSVFGATVNVSEHGVVPGKDTTFELYQLIQSLKGTKDVTLVFPKGKYEFYPEHAYEEFRAVSNHDNSSKHIAFPLFGFENITVDGGDSQFNFHGRIVPFTLENVDGGTLKNFSITWERSFQTEMTVVESNQEDKSFVVSIDSSKYPYTVEYGVLKFKHRGWVDFMGANMVWDPKTRSPIHETRDYGVWNKNIKASKVGKNLVKIEAGNKAPLPVGSVLVSYGNNPTSRLAQAIHLEDSKDIEIKDVTILDAGGMGVIAERVENVTLDHLVVTSREDRLISTRADATHFIGCKGLIKLENCLFEHMLDDGINVHGAYVRVDKYLGGNRFLCAASHPQQWGFTFAGEGDEIALLSRETVLPFFKSTVESVEVVNQQMMIITLADTPDEMPADALSMENLSWYPDLIMRNNVIRENRARSALITTKGKVLVENNYFSSQMHGILIEGDNKHWYESGGVENIIIRNNEFVNIGYEGADRYPLYASPMFTPEQRMGEGQYHRNIEFSNNTLKSFNGHLAFCRSIQGLKIENNTMEFSSDYPIVNGFPTIDIRYCDDVSISGNLSKGFKEKSEISVVEDSTNVTISGNKGYKSE